ncbi:MAG TPA: phosphoethanolamine--lipid A transferase [Ramlibacter sp.]|uniref:phosphoethanolamine transferase n=1 Tax=Ramlibacter sp. TaxID=1917967 RepID=UPI002D8099E7|nr:phosphoethanolamine--lipid A transferase [Ramlibacter sp.]HET8748720.1 phosphoethanolamine--lipid A transferase [Ramlibacter sp.]
MEERQPRRVPAAFLVGGASAWMATAGNAALWRELQSLGIAQAQGGWLLSLTLAGMVGAALYALLSLFAWKRVLKPAIVLLLVATAAGAHFMWTYRIVIDGAMATNTLQTDWAEARALLTPRFAATVLLGGLLPAWLVWRVGVAHRPWKQQALRNLTGLGAGLAVVVVLILLSFQPLASTMRNHTQLRYLLNPLNQLWAVGQSTLGQRKVKGPLAPLGRDARLAAAPPGAKPRLLVLVLGETGRSGNFGINGYERDTTPELARAQAVSFRNAWACGTSTAASVPCMFSHLGREGFLARTQESENLLDVLQHAGLAVLWIDNQPGGCKGVCARIPNVNTSATKDAALCPGGECRDEILVQGLDERLAQLPEAQRRKGVVLVMHQMGSHGPAYAQRTPPAFKKFMPECTSSHLPDCSAEQLRNAYDNTIAYTDHVLGAAIGWLRSRADYDGALLYVADHGESLGENNLYLHGLPYAIAPDVQKHVPWVTWMSPGFQQASGVTMQCLREHADARITHDHLFHSVLGLMQVGTAAYRRGFDAYAGCEAP